MKIMLSSTLLLILQDQTLAADNSIKSSNIIVNTPSVGPVTPRKALCRAILAAVQPTQSNLTASALQNAEAETKKDEKSRK